MDANKRKTTQAVIKRTLDNLEKNRFKAVYVNTKEEALKLISTLIPEGSYTASGGSVTLVETGIMDYIKEHTDYHKEYMDAYAADYYLVSANAITEHGELYEVDGRSNRVSAMLFGPKNVIVVAGINKLVPNVRRAIERVKEAAAPANSVRLGLSNPCTNTGRCASPSFSEEHICALGCASEGRICCSYTVFGPQRVPGRITVIIIGEDYGY